MQSQLQFVGMEIEGEGAAVVGLLGVELVVVVAVGMIFFGWWVQEGLEEWVFGSGR